MIYYLRTKHSYALKLIICMKLMMILTCICLHVSANVFSQKVSISLKNASLQNVLKEIEQKSDVRFVYSSEVLSDNKVHTITFTNKQIDYVLKHLLKGTNLDYSKSANNLIVISAIQQSTITGTVRDTNGGVMTGATVRLRGTNEVTTTDVEGKFSIKIPSNGGILIVSYLGFEDFTTHVTTTQNIDIVMQPSADSQLDEIIVVGYGTQNKSKVSDALTTVKMDEVMRDRPLSNAGVALEGTIPGLNISVSSGQPGTKPGFNIRGWSSINGGDPLFVVDNIPMEDISLLNPADFESVTVLKDASASVLYGARAAFGVVLITTKKGSLNQPLNFEYAAGISPTIVSTLPKKLTPREWVDVLKRIGQDRWWSGPDIHTFDSLLNYYDKNPGQLPANGIVTEGTQKYSLKSHDQFGAYFEGGNEQYHNFTASGGSEKIFFRSSIRLVNENGVIVGPNDKFKRWSTDNTISTKLTSSLDFQGKIMYNNFNRTEPGDGFNYPFYAMVTQPSFTPIGYDSVMVNGVKKYLPYQTQNNMVQLQNPKIRNGDQIRLGTKLNFKLVENLTVTGEYTFEKTSEVESRANNNSLIETIHGEYLTHQTLDPNAQSWTEYYRNNYLKNHQILNVYAKYDFTQLGDHHADVMIGTNQEYIDYAANGVSRKGLLSLQAPAIKNATGAIDGWDGYYRNAISGYFGQIHYDYKNKYIVQLSGRYDGSSRYLAGNRFGFFPSGSIAWNIMSEDFMSSNTFFNTLKLRSSYGAIGNQVIKDVYYPEIAAMDAYNTNWLNLSTGLPYTGIGTPPLISNTLTWERVTTAGVGIDATMLRNRMSVNFDYFVRTTTGMMTDAKALPQVLGTGAPRQNLADLRSNGFELSIGWNDRIGDVKYGISMNLSDDKGKITRFDNPSGALWMYYEGQNLGEIWGYESKGLFQKDHFEGLNGTNEGGKLTDQAKNNGWVPFEGVNQNPGDMAFVDQNGDGVINGGDWTLENPGDRKVIGNTSHRYRFGINGSLGYKGFDFSFFINGVAKRDLYIDNAFTQPWKDQYFDILAQNTDFWTVDNPNAHFYRLYPNGGGNQWTSRNTQTRYLLSGAYLRVKNLALGYTLPTEATNKIFMKKIRLFISAENMFTIDNLQSGMDPGTDILNDWSGGTYPYIKKFNFGINVNF